MPIPKLDIPQKKWTYTDYAALGESFQGEVRQGDLYMTPAPNLFHQRVCRKLLILLHSWVESKSLGEILQSPVDVILDDSNIVQPDLVFVATAHSNILKQRGIVGIPDLVIEIVSPGSVSIDYYEKRTLYEQFQIPEYWIVDPRYYSIQVLSLEQGKYVVFSHAETKGEISSRILDGLKIAITQIIAVQEE